MLEDEKYRALQEQVHLLQELTKHPGWQELTAVAHDLMEPVKRSLLNGAVKGHEEYLKSAFLCVGIHRILDIPQVAFKKLDEEQRQRVEKDVPLT